MQPALAGSRADPRYRKLLLKNAISLLGIQRQVLGETIVESTEAGTDNSLGNRVLFTTATHAPGKADARRPVIVVVDFPSRFS